MSRFEKVARRYERELVESVIPFWQRHGIDDECGGYFTFLDRDGSVYDTEKFMWMQWRIVYMFAWLATTDYARPEWVDLAWHGYRFLVRHGQDEHGDYYFGLNRRGEPSMAPYNIFSNCFAAMGAAALYRATGDASCRDEAERAMTRYLARMDNPKGQWEKSMTGRPHRLNLGHFMMLANLGRELNTCLETDRYEADIREAADKVLGLFWNREHRVLMENVGPDGTVDYSSCDGRHLNPGHGLEAMWFLMSWAADHDDRETIDRCAEVVDALLEFGWDDTHGGIYYFMDVLGKPHVELQADMKLWWVHNEAILATLWACKLTGRQVFFDWFRKLDDYTWRLFPDPQHGEWFGYLNRRGEPTHSLKGGKWKTFFHLPRCLLTGTALLRSL